MRLCADTIQDIAKEVAGEVGSFVKGVHRAGLLRGMMGYLKRDEGLDEVERDGEEEQRW